MPAVLQLVLTLPSLTFRSTPVWMMNYMVTLRICRTKPGFLKLGTIDGLGLDIHSLFLGGGGGEGLSRALWDASQHPGLYALDASSTLPLQL